MAKKENKKIKKKESQNTAEATGPDALRVKKREERDKKLREKYPPKVVIKRLLGDMKPIKWGIIISAFLLIVSVTVWLTVPQIISNSIGILNDFFEGKAVTAPNDFVSGFAKLGGVLDGAQIVTYISLWCAVLLACYLAKGIAEITKIIILNNTVSRHFTATLRIRMSDKIKRLPVSFVDTTPYGELIARMMHDVSRMGNTVHTFMEMLIMGIIQITAITVIMFFINPILAAVVLITIPVSVLLAAFLAKKSEKYHHNLHRAWGDLYAGVEEHYGGYNTVKAYNLEERQERKVGGIIGRIIDNGTEAGFYSEIVQPIISFTFNISFVVICIIGGYMAIKGSMGMNVTQIVKLVMYSKMLASPLETIANSLSNFQRVLVSSRRVYDVLDTEELMLDENYHITETKGNVSFKNVAFSYTETPLITDLSFEVKSGQKIAIVGPTGGGKTTIVNLLMRFYDIKKGTITIDGVSIADIPRSELRNSFSMVLQDTWLFKGTVEENVAYGKENVTHDEVVAACDTAYCDHFIRTLPKGYDTEISNDFTSISAGQKQLLTIARAFIANRKMLILDEATSNVDTRTEIYIQKAMDKLMKGRTSFVIAHRLSTIINADLILVINNGDIVESGTHKALLEKKGFYHTLYNSQYALIQE